MPIHYLWSPHGVRDEIYEQNYTVKPDFYVNIISQKGLVEYVYIYTPQNCSIKVYGKVL